MKARLFGLAALLAANSVYAADPSLSTDKHKLSYTIGFQFAHQLRGDGLDVDAKALSQAISDVLGGAEPKLTMQEMQAAMDNFQKARMDQQKAIGEQNLKAGQEFLDKKKKEAGVTALPTGEYYKVLKKGTGPKPKVTDTVTVHYKGTLINGVKFDSSYDRGQPATFPLNGVIKGWQDVLPQMEEGSKWEVYIPGNLAYGERGGPGGEIGPNETLIFEIELVSIAKK